MTDDTTTTDDFNEHNIRAKTVNGATLKQHRGYDRDMSTTARRILAREDGVSEVNVARHTMTVWFRRCDRINWEPPEGYDIESVSLFGEPDEHTGGHMALTLRPEGSA